jgi:hypothetical protein
MKLYSHYGNTASKIVKKLLLQLNKPISKTHQIYSLALYKSEGLQKELELDENTK